MKVKIFVGYFYEIFMNTTVNELKFYVYAHIRYGLQDGNMYKLPRGEITYSKGWQLLETGK